MKPEDWKYFADKYEEKMISLSSIPERQKQVAEAIKPGKILNIGCGCITKLNEFLVERGNVVVATDFCKPMLEEAKARFDHENLIHIFADSNNLPFNNESFDSVIAVNSILTENREEVDKIIKEVYRVLKTNGKFVAFLCSYEANKELVNNLGIKNIFLDEKEFKVGVEKEWEKIFQCFHSPETIERLMKIIPFSKFKYEKIINNTTKEIEMIKSVHKVDTTNCPIYSYLLIAEK